MDQGRSHVNSFQPLMHKLQGHNHSVDLYFNIFEKEIDFGMNEAYIDVSKLHKSFRSNPDFIRSQWYGVFDIAALGYVYSLGAETCRIVLNKKRNEFEALKNGSYDLIMTDSLFSVCGYGIAETHKSSYVIMHSTDVESATGTCRGYQRNYGIIPRFIMAGDEMKFEVTSFRDRLYSSLEWMGGLFFINFNANRDMHETLQSVTPDFSFCEYNRKAAMAFSDMPLSLYPPVSRTNDLFNYGENCKAEEPLKEEFIQFIDENNSKGTIVVAFGTIVDWRQAPDHVLDAYINVLNNLADYRIFWCYQGKTERLAPHIYAHPWLPVADLLNHNSTRLFITHGGLKSVKESACSGVPTLYMPLFSEQGRNSYLMKNLGTAEILNKFKITEEYLNEHVTKILNTPRYSENAKRLQGFFTDRPMDALAEGVFRVNQLLKYAGNMPRYFYTRSIDLSYTVTMNVDLFCLIGLSIVVVSF